MGRRETSGPVGRATLRCSRLTVSAARTNMALLIRRAVRCSANAPAKPGTRQVAALRHEEKGRVLARPGWAGAKRTRSAPPAKRSCFKLRVGRVEAGPTV